MKKLNFLKYCLIIVFFIIYDIHAQSGAWTKKADIPKGGGSASVVNGKIYVVGGTKLPGITDLSFNEMYDPSTNSWIDKAPMPTARGFLSTAVVNDTIYAIGGGYPYSKKKVEAYDPLTDTWSTKADMLDNRLGAQAAVVNGIIYNFGGNYTSRNCEAYDPSTNTWTKKTDMPEGGGVVSVTAYNGLIYVFGGGYYNSFPFVYVYNPQTETWTKKKDMPTSRFAFQTFLVDGKIYALGGAQKEYGSSLATVEVYDPDSDTWESKSNMPINLALFAGAVISNKIYVIGGTSNWATANSYSVWEYDPKFHTDIAAGNVSGIWTLAKSPYYINGEITIPNDSTLTIEPGVEVVFMGHYKFNVQGRLFAVGTQKDSIRFTAADKQAGWHGIRFINTPNTNDTSQMVYCSFKYGKANTGAYISRDRCGGAIYIQGFDKILISNSLFESNMNDGDISSATRGAAIYVASTNKPIITNSTFLNNTGTTDCAILSWYSNVIISNNVFSNNSGPHGPVFCGYNSPTISGNIISNNRTTRAGGGIFNMTSNATVTNNIIIYNKSFGMEGEGGGIKCWINDKSIIINNTIAYNSAAHGGGICCNSNSDPIFINNIIWGNTSPDGNQVNLVDRESDPHFLYCDIQARKEGFGGNGAGANYSGIYESNIDLDPLFKDTAAIDYSLSDPSHCIGAGFDSAEVGGAWYHIPQFCIMGNSRPSPADSRPDIGACESLLASPNITGVENELTYPTEFILYQNYPNPFNPTTSIGYQLSAFSQVTLKVYDILGKEVTTLVNKEKQAGSYEVKWNAANLPSGVYFYQLKAGSFLSTKKMVFMK